MNDPRHSMEHSTWITKDSGVRQEYDSGMRRDTQENKPDFWLITPKDMPYEEQLLTRWAALMERGAQKYSSRNWEKANSEEELDRFKASAFRHLVQALLGEDDEDHFAAVCFNLNAVLYVQWRMRQQRGEELHAIREELDAAREM